MLRGTQAAISFLTDPAFIKQSEGYLKSYLAFWGTHSEAFQNTVKAIILSPGLLRSCGAIIVDYQTSTLFLSEHYHQLDKIPAFAYVNGFEEEPKATKIGKLFSQGLIKGFTVKGEEEEKPLPANIKSPTDLILHAKQHWANVEYTIQYDPWKIEKFEDTQKGVTNLGQELSSIGMLTNLESIIMTKMADSWQKEKQFA
jgi:hypothetical protein